MATDPFLFSFQPIKGILEKIKHLKEGLGPSDLDPSHKLYSKAKEKKGKTKLETNPDLDLDEAVFLRSKSYSV